MKTINRILTETMESLPAPTLQPAMETLIQISVLADARICLESIVRQFDEVGDNVVQRMVVEDNYRQWLADSDVGNLRSESAESVEAEARALLETLNEPAMESELLGALKRSFNNISTKLKTFGKDIFEIKTKLKGAEEDIVKKPVLLQSVDAYRFLTKDGKPVSNFSACLDDDVKFFDSAEKHYTEIMEKVKGMSKQFRTATTSKSAETIRDIIDEFDDNLVDRNQFRDLEKLRLVGNRIVELDKRGYPKLTSLKGNDIKFTLKDKDESNLQTQIAKGTMTGFSFGGEPKGISGIVGMNMIEGRKNFLQNLNKGKGVVEMAELHKVIDKANRLSTDSIRFAQMAASMTERVDRMTDDLNDAYDELVDKETGEIDKVIKRELIDLHKSARRSVSQYMFIGKLLATMMEDHALYIYRGVTLMANNILSNTKPSK